MLREELQLLQEQGSYVGEVVKPMDKKKVLVKVYSICKHEFLACNGPRFFKSNNNLLLSWQVHPEGKFVVDLDKNIDINDVTPNCRVALRNDSYTLHKILPNKVSAFYSESKLMKLVLCSVYSFVSMILLMH